MSVNVKIVDTIGEKAECFRGYKYAEMGLSSDQIDAFHTLRSIRWYGIDYRKRIPLEIAYEWLVWSAISYPDSKWFLYALRPSGRRVWSYAFEAHEGLYNAIKRIGLSKGTEYKETFGSKMVFYPLGGLYSSIEIMEWETNKCYCSVNTESYMGGLLVVSPESYINKCAVSSLKAQSHPKYYKVSGRTYAYEGIGGGAIVG